MKNEQIISILNEIKCEKELAFIYPTYHWYPEPEWKKTSTISSEFLHLRKVAMSTVNKVDDNNKFAEQKVKNLSTADANIVIACAEELTQVVAKYKKKYLESVGRNDIVEAFGMDKICD